MNWMFIALAWTAHSVKAGLLIKRHYERKGWGRVNWMDYAPLLPFGPIFLIAVLIANCRGENQ